MLVDISGQIYPGCTWSIWSAWSTWCCRVGAVWSTVVHASWLWSVRYRSCTILITADVGNTWSIDDQDRDVSDVRTPLHNMQTLLAVHSHSNLNQNLTLIASVLFPHWDCTPINNSPKKGIDISLRTHGEQAYCCAARPPAQNTMEKKTTTSLTFLNCSSVCQHT